MIYSYNSYKGASKPNPIKRRRAQTSGSNGTLIFIHFYIFLMLYIQMYPKSELLAPVSRSGHLRVLIMQWRRLQSKFRLLIVEGRRTESVALWFVLVPCCLGFFLLHTCFYVSTTYDVFQGIDCPS
jgi:hypothetical protein